MALTAYQTCPDCGDEAYTESLNGGHCWACDWRELDKLRGILAAVYHTLEVHGHIDAGTPLHARVRGICEKSGA